VRLIGNNLVGSIFFLLLLIVSWAEVRDKSKKGGLVMREWGLLGEREVKGYLFKLYDEDEWGFLVEIWKDDEKIGTEWTTCRGANCEPTDDELLALVEKLELV